MSYCIDSTPIQSNSTNKSNSFDFFFVAFKEFLITINVNAKTVGVEKIIIKV